MKTEMLQLRPEDYDPAALDRPAEVLRAGGLVAFPTETVYGIGANPGCPGAVDRLLAVRQSPPDKLLTLHIADPRELDKRIAGPVPPAARRLMRKFWPGPLTLVFPTPDGRSIGFRYPANRIAVDLIARVGVPLVAPSANRSGQPPALAGAEVLKMFDGAIDWVVDGGPSRFGKASTVVRMRGRECEVLREGVIPSALILEQAGTTVLFVCTGNTCRSPMAAALFRRKLAQRHGIPEDELESRGFRVLSAGTTAPVGSPANPLAVDAVRAQGGRLEGHLTQPVTVRMLEEADVVYAMTEAHRRTLSEWVQEGGDRIRLVDPEGGDVEDPMGGSPGEYRACAARLNQCLEAALRELCPV